MQTYLIFDRKQDLLDSVLHQIVRDIQSKDFTAIEELIRKLPDEDLIAYLPEEFQENS